MSQQLTRSRKGLRPAHGHKGAIKVFGLHLEKLSFVFVQLCLNYEIETDTWNQTLLWRETDALQLDQSPIALYDLFYHPSP